MGAFGYTVPAMRKAKTIVAVFLGLGLTLPASTLAATGDVTNYLGRIYAGDGEAAINAQFDRPRGFAVTRDGSVYIADSENNVVRRVKGSTQIVSKMAGNGNVGAKDGAAAGATFNQPADVAVWRGRVLIADSGNGRVRSWLDGVVRSVARGLKRPEGLKVYGNALYVADTGNHRILRMSPTTGRIFRRYPVASPGKFVKLGNALYAITNDGTAVTRINLSNRFGRIIKFGLTDAGGIAVVNGTIVFSDGANGIYNNLWQYAPATGTFTLLVDGRLETEWYNYISDLEFVNGKLYAAISRGSSVFTMDADGGNPVRIAGEHRYGDRDGASTALLLGRPKDLQLSADGGTLYILENHKVKAYDLAGKQLRLLAGHANDNYVEGTSGSEGRMSGPNQIVVSPTRVYFADRNNNRIRYVTVATGTTGYLTGAGAKNSDGKTRNGYTEGGPCPNEFEKGVAGCAYFNRPNGIEISKDGTTLYVADTQNHRIRAVNVATGRTSLLAGGGKATLKNGIGGRALFHTPWTLELSADGKTLYVADRGNHAIRAIDLATRAVTTVTGTGRSGFRNGAFTQARFSFPEYVAVGPDANTLLVSEAGTNRIRKLQLNTQEVTTLAGSGRRGSTNGTAGRATFNQPKGMVVLGSKLLVADQLNDLIRAVQL